MKLEYDIIVVGGGHAGCEAAAAAAALGSQTLLVTMDMTKFAQMSCNPAVGGVAKGQIVREIDAMGGYMGIITDRTTIQFRMLNRSKGPAMWSPRAQCDKQKFSEEWRRTLENIDNLYLWQDSVTEILTEPLNTASCANDTRPSLMTAPENSAALSDTSSPFPENDSFAKGEKFGQHSENSSCKELTPEPEAKNDARAYRICGVRTRMGVEFRAKAVILTNGTFLNGLMHIGRTHAEGGRSGDASSYGLTENLVRLGFEAGRMKTGTPSRLDARSIDFSKLEPQYGDENPAKFSFLPETEPVKTQLPCYLVYTSSEVHDTLRTGFGDSPLFQGIIQGIGPRYCPSIEDKLRTFADKEMHQLFLEPEGAETHEYYLNGFSSSLPWQVQIEALQKIEGLENVQLYRPGYAIEYDYFPPIQLFHTLETKRVERLYFAGQINGTTGYEEAGAQGMMAGINAHQKINEKEPLVLQRDESYIGVLIDDLVTKGVDEPYRMFTSRAEYRILLRQDNADLRLTPISHKIGLCSNERHAIFEQKKSLVESLINFVRDLSITPSDLQSYLISINSAPMTQGRKLYDILLRNDVTLKGLIGALPDTLGSFIGSDNRFTDEIIEEAEIQIKYKGYIERERFMADKLHRLENIRIPEGFDFHSLQSLSIESRQKLTRIRPETIGQASRIPGVSPADINVLLIYFGR